MAAWYKSHGREMTPNNEDEALAKKLEADGWSTEKPETVEEMLEEIPVFTERTVEEEVTEGVSEEVTDDDE